MTRLAAARRSSASCKLVRRPSTSDRSCAAAESYKSRVIVFDMPFGCHTSSSWRTAEQMASNSGEQSAVTDHAAARAGQVRRAQLVKHLCSTAQQPAPGQQEQQQVRCNGSSQRLCQPHGQRQRVQVVRHSAALHHPMQTRSGSQCAAPS